MFSNIIKGIPRNFAPTRTVKETRIARLKCFIFIIFNFISFFDISMRKTPVNIICQYGDCISTKCFNTGKLQAYLASA